MNTRVEHHLSMNLGQAVAVCLYEIAREMPVSTPADEETAATAGDLERLTELLRDVLDRCGYTRRHPANAREANVRRLVRRMGLVEGDAAVWTGVLRMILRRLGAITDTLED